jgi:ComF family protein
MLCRKCGAFFANDAAPVPVSCHRCDDHHYDKAAAVGVYEKALAASIVNLKSTPHLPPRIISAIEAFGGSDIFLGIEVIVPVPLSRQRRFERGFNQAEIIARAVSHVRRLDVDSISLARTVHTPLHRVGMDQKARELTIHKAFEVKRRKLIEGRHVLLVDDVLTSGATASQAAKALKKAGAAGVKVFTLGRAVLN